MKFNQKKLTNQSQNSNAIGFKKLTWFFAWNWLGMTYALWNSHLWKQKNATMEFWKLLCLVCSYNRSSAVNCRSFPQQLLAADFIIRQITVASAFRLLHVFFSHFKCVYNNFQFKAISQTCSWIFWHSKIVPQLVSCLSYKPFCYV